VNIDVGRQNLGSLEVTLSPSEGPVAEQAEET
jgi:hypothetical protein